MVTKLKLSEKYYRYLFENASDAMWVHDGEGRIIGINKACEKLVGYSRDELIGKNIREFLSDAESLNLAREVRRNLLNGVDFSQPYEQRLTTKNGDIRIVNMSTNPVIIKGKETGFQHVARDITEERQLRENMQHYIQQITRAQEDERARVARELHDELSPPLLLLVRRLDLIYNATKHLQSSDMEEKIEDLHQLVLKALEGVRHCAQDLRPRILDDLGLLPAIEWLINSLRNEKKIRVKITVKGRKYRLDPERELNTFRIIQEVLSNVRRHSKASTLDVIIDFGSDFLSITARDDGQGFQLPRRASDLVLTGKLGIIGMQERARLIGSTLEVNSVIGEGTEVFLQVPTSQ